MRWRAGVWGVVLALAVAATQHASAQPRDPARDPAAAETFFAEGRALLKEGKLAEACSKFEASQKLDPANGTLMNLADCYEKSGRHASAWLAFREAAAGAANAGQAARAAHARSRAASVEPKLCRLRVDVESPARPPTFSVLRDGAPLDPSVWGQAVPVDPGRHTVTVQRGESVLFSRDIAVSSADGACETKTVVVSGIVEAAAPVEVKSGAGTGTGTGTGEKGARSDEKVPTRTNVVPLVVAGVGVVGLGLSALFIVQAKDSWNDAKSKCVPAGCGPEAQARANDAKTEAGISTLAFIGGGVLVAGGVTWWLLAPTVSVGRNTVAIAPALGETQGVTASGHF